MHARSRRVSLSHSLSYCFSLLIWFLCTHKIFSYCTLLFVYIGSTTSVVLAQHKTNVRVSMFTMLYHAMAYCSHCSLSQCVCALVCGIFCAVLCDNKLLLIALNELKAFVSLISHAFTTWLSYKKMTTAAMSSEIVVLLLSFFQSLSLSLSYLESQRNREWTQKWHIDQYKHNNFKFLLTLTGHYFHSKRQSFTVLFCKWIRTK